MVKVFQFSISRLNNAEITGFFINLQKLVETSDYETIGVSTAQLNQLRNTLKLLVDQVYNTNGSQYTQNMQAADARRDLIYKRIRLKLQAVEVAEEGSDLANIASKVKVNLLTKYSSKVPTMAYQAETAVLQGFLMDLRKLDEDEMALLGIEGDIVALEQANADFIAAYQSRSGERAEKNSGVTNMLRAEMCEIYDLIVLNVQYHANGSDAAKAANCQEFLKSLNVMLSDAKQRLDQRGKGGDESGSEEGGDKPAGGDKPSSGDSGNGGSGGDNGGSQPGGPTLDDDMIAW